MQTTHETLKILLGSDARVRPDEQQGKSAMGGSTRSVQVVIQAIDYSSSIIKVPRHPGE